MEKTFSTPLGLVRCGIKSDSANQTTTESKHYPHGESDSVHTALHRIECITFKIEQPLANGMTVADTCGWMFRIEKIEPGSEVLELYCQLDITAAGVECSSDDGEYLQAVEAKNADWTLHIGTEDGEIMNQRAKLGDDYPARLYNPADFPTSITQTTGAGLLTIIPTLEVGETMALHYITAYDHTAPDQVTTWFAVDHFKEDLEEWIGY